MKWLQSSEKISKTHLDLFVNNLKQLKMETIEVKHDTGNRIDGIEIDVNEKEIYYEWNKYKIFVNIAGDGHYYKGMRLQLMHDNCDVGFRVNIVEKKGKLYLSLDADGGQEETEAREYLEWLKLEKLQKAIRLIGNIFK